MSSYTVKTGDTFQTVSRISYGTEIYSTTIARANPGVSEPLVASTVLNIPALPFEPLDSPQLAVAQTPDDVVLIIGGEVFRFWSEITVTNSMDTLDTVVFSAPFNPDDPRFRERFKPFGFQSVQVFIGGEQVFTGRMINIAPSLSTNARTIVVECYSTPGVLMDCMIPASMYADRRSDNEFRGQSLRQIATTVCEPLSVFVSFQDDPGATFEKVAIDPTERVWDFLAGLASQRELIMKNDEFGQLIFTKEKTSKPVAKLVEGSSPLMQITPQFNPRSYYSHLTGIDTSRVGRSGSQYTVKNGRLNGYTRPFTYAAGDTDKADMKQAVETQMGRMFANMISYSAQVSTWQDPDGNRWDAGSRLTIEAPGAMIYNEYDFTIRSVVFNATPTSRIANFELMIPGSFAGQIPEFLPWD